MNDMCTKRKIYTLKIHFKDLHARTHYTCDPNFYHQDTNDTSQSYLFKGTSMFQFSRLKLFNFLQTFQESFKLNRHSKYINLKEENFGWLNQYFLKWTMEFQSFVKNTEC